MSFTIEGTRLNFYGFWKPAFKRKKRDLSAGKSLWFLNLSVRVRHSGMGVLAGWPPIASDADGSSTWSALTAFF